MMLCIDVALRDFREILSHSAMLLLVLSIADDEEVCLYRCLL